MGTVITSNAPSKKSRKISLDTFIKDFNRIFLFKLIIVITSCLSSCISPSIELHRAELNTEVEDSLTITNGVKYEKYIPIFENDYTITEDTTNFEKKLISLLNENNLKSKFRVDSLLIEGFGGDWYFWQGHLFSKNKEHAVIFIDGAQFPVFVFEKQNEKWRSIKKIEYPRPLNHEKTIQFKDFNFDGIIDLGLNHGDFGGHFSCTNCYKIFLYDEIKNDLVPVDVFNHYIDVQFDNIEKAVYLGKHGYESTFYKCKWNRDKLIPKEMFSFYGSQDGGKGGVIYNKDYEYSCTRRYYKIIGNNKVLLGKKKTCHLPAKWEQIFKFQ